MSYIGGPLPGQEKEEESENKDLIQSYKDRTIGKETIDRTISAAEKIFNSIPEPVKQVSSTAGHLLKDTYMDVRTVKGKEWLDPADVITAGAVRAVEGLGWLSEKLIAKPAEVIAHKALGIDPRGAKFLGIATEIAVTAGGAPKAAKYVKSGAAMSDLTEFAFKTADPESIAGMVYRTGGGVAPVPKQLTNIVKSNKDFLTELSKSNYYKGLKKKYQYITPEQFVDSPKLQQFLHREEVLQQGIRQVKTYEKARDLAAKIPANERGRALKRAEKNLKTTRRTTLEHASLNLLDDEAKHIFFMNRKGLKEGLSEIFAGDGIEWHHIFGNKETGNLFLNELAQDTMITVNVMEHLKKLKLGTAGIRKNLTVMRKDPHNELHTMLRNRGFEQGKELDFADLMQSLSKDIVSGKADINEFFTMLDVYAARTQPWLKKKAVQFGGKEMSEIPMDSYIEKYQGQFQKNLQKLNSN